MSTYIPLILFVLVPVLLVTILRTSAAILYFCVTSAVLLQRFIDQDAATAANSLLPDTGVDYMALTVLIVPIAITAFLFRKTVKAHLLPLHLVVATCAGLTVSLVASSFFPASTVAAYEDSEIWHDIANFQTIIVGGGFLLSVICLSLSKPHDRRKHHH